MQQAASPSAHAHQARPRWRAGCTGSRTTPPRCSIGAASNAAEAALAGRELATPTAARSPWQRADAGSTVAAQRLLRLRHERGARQRGSVRAARPPFLILLAGDWPHTLLGMEAVPRQRERSQRELAARARGAEHAGTRAACASCERGDRGTGSAGVNASCHLIVIQRVRSGYVRSEYSKCRHRNFTRLREPAELLSTHPR